MFSVFYNEIKKCNNDQSFVAAGFTLKEHCSEFSPLGRGRPNFSFLGPENEQFWLLNFIICIYVRLSRASEEIITFQDLKTTFLPTFNQR